MKTISPGLKSFLASTNDVLRIELVTITLQQGAGVIYLTSLDRDVTYNGHVYLSGDQGINPGFKRGNVTTGLGTDTKTMELTLFCGPGTKVNGVLLPTFADYGGFDNAIVEVDCLPVAPAPVINTSNGTYNIWTGVVGDVKVDRTEVMLEVSSMLRFLQGAFPRNYTLPTCNNTLFDAACTLLKATYAVTGSVASAVSTAQFNTGLTQADGYFDLGWVVWTSGQNNGLVRTVKTYKNSGGNVLLVDPLPYLPQGGDTFTAYPGDDKTQATCTNKFNNLAHFRGFPYMPNPLTLMAGQNTGPTPGSGGPGGGPGGGGGGTSSNFKQF